MIQKKTLDTDYNIREQMNKDNSMNEIEVSRGIGSYFPIFISLGITLYGMYLFISTITKNENIIYGTLGFMAILILFIEAHRTDLLKDFLSSKLTREIHTDFKISNFALFMSGVITALFISLDLWGALQSSDKIERLLVVGIVENSKEYQILDNKAKSGAEANKIYSDRLNLYNQAKQSHYKSCNDSWQIRRYRTKNTECKNSFKQIPPKQSSIKVGDTVSSDDYERLSSKAKETIQGYRDIFFYVFFGFSLLLNYFAVSTLVNQYRNKLRELSDEATKSELLNRYEILENEKLNKLKESTKIQHIKTNEKNVIDVAMEGLTYDILLAKSYKSLEGMKRVPIAISNNQSINQGNRGGFMDLGKTVNTKQYIPNEETIGNTERYIPNGNNTIDYSLFDIQEQELISLLFDNGNIPIGGQLVKRDIILDIVGHNKPNANRLRDLYSKLMELDYIYKKVAYFSKATI